MLIRGFAGVCGWGGGDSVERDEGWSWSQVSRVDWVRWFPTLSAKRNGKDGARRPLVVAESQNG